MKKLTILIALRVYEILKYTFVNIINYYDHDS